MLLYLERAISNKFSCSPVQIEVEILLLDEHNVTAQNRTLYF